jgi:hypothetical protein
MQILATVQGSAMSNEPKLQLDSSVGTYLNRYLKVQSTQGGCDEICTRVRVDLVPSQPRLRAGSGSRPGIVQVQVQVQVVGRVNTSCIIYLLQIYLSCALAVQTRCLRKVSSVFVVCVTVA